MTQNQSSARPLHQRWLAGALSIFMGFAPLATPVYAAGYSEPTKLADGPINVKNQAKPNILLTIDDSTSMLYDFLPDYVVGNYCRDGKGAMNAACGYRGSPTSAGPGGQYVSPQYIWEQPKAPFPNYATGAGAVPNTFNPQLFSDSGPGAGCNLTPIFPNPPSCTGGIDPGALPGLATYAINSGSPQAGLPYEYWHLWPAPVHNSALNHVYYNPRLNYDPPAYPNGSSFPQMNSANTNAWKKVPSDPYDNPSDPLDCTTALCVNLTANVIVGQWCNSDWTQGNDDSGTAFMTNPGHCRVNGLVAAISAGAPAAIGDYRYPWAPAGITPNDVTSKVDTSVISISPPTNASVKAAWSGAQNPKYFYENDNVLWCDITSAAWPQTGPTVPQTCQGISNPQTCTPNPTQPTCGGGAGGTCGGAIAAGTCNGFIAQRTCTGFSKGVCAGNQAGACNGQPGVCTAPAAGTCNSAPTCTGAVAAACNGVTKEACVGGSPASCNNIVAETCNGGTQNSCNPVAQTCNGAGAQTCANIVEIPPNPATCTSGWVPAGCNVDPNPEGTCVYTTTCPPSTFAGKCSIQTSKTCTSNAECPFVNGTCSVAANSCASNSDCALKRCQGASSGSCSVNTDCPITGGTCNKTGQACTINAGVSTCPPAGNCNNPPNAVCTSNPGSCPAISARCATTTATTCPTVMGNSPSCPVVPLSGTCNNPPNAKCTTVATCPAITNKCSNAPATTCASAAACPQTGTCSNGGAACNVSANCVAVGTAKCTNSLSPKLGLACVTNAFCDKVGVCTNSLAPPSTACTIASQCTQVGKCTNAGATFGSACTTNSTNSAACQDLGACPAGSDVATCTVTGSTTQCKKSGTCTNRALSCTSNAQCTAVQGKCSAGKPNTTNCSVNSDCTVANTCGSSQNNGAACNPANITATCTPLGTCSIKGNACTTATTAADCAQSGFCSIQTTKVCFANSDCANQAGPMDPNTARCDTFGVSGGANGDYTKTLLADANGAGNTCRRNNHAYASDGTTASQTNYPSGKFTTPVSGENTAGLGCHATDRYASLPRHYWKTEVEWCDTFIGTPGDPWLGYGKPDVSCQESYDAVTHPYPRFYQFGGAPTVGAAVGTDNVATPAFARVDLDITKPSATFTAVAEFGSGLSDVTRDFTINTTDTPDVSEMTNYANWFAYYRTRILAVKSVTSLAFLGKTLGTFNVDTSFRVGFHTLFNTPSTSFVNIADFDAAQKTTWAKQLFAIDIPMGHETPTLDAMARAGDFFLNGTSAELPGSIDPIILSCQKNWHMFFTDGFTNQNPPKVNVGDQDDVVPNYPDNLTNPIAGLTPGAAWPSPLREDGGSKASDAASDYAMNYWVTDLRTSGAMAVNNVPGTQLDPATWQHLNFAALALGTAGTLPPNAFDTPPYPQWPKPVPTVNKPDATGVDDLWHAATNGRGAFINAQSADELKLGMGSILADIGNQSGARAGAGFQSANITGANNFIYRALFQPGWYGTLTKIQIDPVTGAEVSTIWEAANQLQAQLTVIAGVKDTPWFTDRNIATMDAKGVAIPFLWANLSAAQKDSLAPAKATRGQRVLEWIRGNTKFEGKKVGQLRSRFHALVGNQFLGDIVDAKPVYVGPPNKGYSESTDLGYAAFTIKYQARSPMVYAGANDGMLHAFADATGNEAFAYVPSALYRGDATGLGALTYQDGALPPFTHHFLVDSTPKPWDVDFGGPDWRTVLVGGLGKGGNSYYALDITDPASITTEAKAVASVLWEFTDANLGYTYGQPTIVKTHATSGGFSAGQWVAIIPSGYDNVDGVGRIFFVDIKTGAKLKEMSTGFGNAGAPAGLAQIAGYTRDVKNQLVEQVYGGDLYGNFWRFDLRDANPGNWVLEKLAKFTDPGGAPQPVTIAPQIEVDVANGVDRWVFIGTGRLLDDSDLAVSQQQTLYAIRDGDVNNPLPIVTTLAPRTDMKLLADRVNGLSSKPDIGWYDDLPPDQRIVVPLQAEISVVAYIGTSPQTDPCLLGQPATVYARGFARGESLLTDSSGTPVAGIYEAEGGVGLQVVQFEPEPGSSLPNIQIAVTLGTGKTIFIKPTLPPFLGAHRMSWRLLGQ